MKAFRPFLLPGLLGLWLPVTAAAAESIPSATAAAPAAAAVPLVNRIIVGSFATAADKIVQLAAAIPADRYDWAPMDGVATVGGILIHITGANYYIANALGTPVPAGVDPRNLGQGASKEELIALYEASVRHAQRAILAVSAEAMQEEIDVFGSKAPRAQLVMILADHTHEHLGQLIAYARSNHVTPPWSQ